MRRAFSLVELLLALSVLGVLLALSLPLLRPSPARRAAGEARAFLQAARLQALARGRPVAVTVEPDGRTLAMRLGDDSERVGEVCARGVRLRRLALRRPGDALTLEPLPRGLVWLPSGAGRACDGSGVFNGTLRLDDGRSRWAVVVASGGRLRLESER